jgi:hypothetical protein
MRFDRVWRWWMIGVAVLMPAAFLLAQSSPDEAPRMVKPRRDDWTLPPAPVRVEPAPGLLATSRIWGVETEATDVPELPRWRIAAVYRTVKGDWELLIDLIGTGRVERLRVGDRLPGGTPIVGIAEDRVCVQLENARRWLPVHEPAATVL